MEIARIEICAQLDKCFNGIFVAFPSCKMKSASASLAHTAHICIVSQK
jgi:hypothetical protein